MKLIIDIPEIDYELAKQRWMRGDSPHKMDYYVLKGIPLDDVKAEIMSKHFHLVEKNDFDIGRTYGYDECLSILDNVGSEE